MKSREFKGFAFCPRCFTSELYFSDGVVRHDIQGSGKPYLSWTSVKNFSGEVKCVSCDERAVVIGLDDDLGRSLRSAWDIVERDGLLLEKYGIVSTDRDRIAVISAVVKARIVGGNVSVWKLSVVSDDDGWLEYEYEPSDLSISGLVRAAILNYPSQLVEALEVLLRHGVISEEELATFVREYAGDLLFALLSFPFLMLRS